MRASTSASSLALLLAASCATTTDSALRTAGGELVRDLPPAACRVAVGPVDLRGAAPTEAGLRLDLDAAGLQQAVVRHLQALRAASEVFAVSGPEAAVDSADLYVSVSADRDAAMVHQGASDQWWSSGLLWMVTWIGGLLVEDSTYDTRLRLRCAVANPRAGAAFGTVDAESGPVDLEYWDRNQVVSLRFLQSLVLPPFWTSDDPDITSKSLTEKATLAATARFARYLKEDLEKSAQQRDVAGFELLEPINGTRAAAAPDGSVRLRFTVTTRDVQPAVVRVGVDGGELVAPDQATAEDQQVDLARQVCRCDVSHLLRGLRPGEHTVQVVVASGGDSMRRTVRFEVARP